MPIVKLIISFCIGGLNQRVCMSAAVSVRAILLIASVSLLLHMIVHPDQTCTQYQCDQTYVQSQCYGLIVLFRRHETLQRNSAIWSSWYGKDTYGQVCLAIVTSSCCTVLALSTLSVYDRGCSTCLIHTVSSDDVFLQTNWADVERPRAEDHQWTGNPGQIRRRVGG